MKERLEAAVADAAAFVERWSAKSLETIEPASLRELLGELAEIRAVGYEARHWAFMLRMTDSENPAVLDIRAWVDSLSPRLDEAIRHFELAWMALPDDRARSLAEDEAVARDRHYLLGVRRFRPFKLSPAEERALSARDASASTAWQTLRNRTLGSLSARFDDGTGEREWPLSELESARRFHRDRDVRRRAQETTAALFEPVLPVLAHCYDSRVADRLAVDRLRGHDDPIDADEPRERARRRDGRGAARRVRGARRDRAPLVPSEGGAARSRAAGRGRPAGCGCRRAAAAVGRGPPAGRGDVRGRDAGARHGGRAVLHREADRRRAEARETVWGLHASGPARACRASSPSTGPGS